MLSAGLVERVAVCCLLVSMLLFFFRAFFFFPLRRAADTSERVCALEWMLASAGDRPGAGGTA